jgi:hypothetical protein
MIRDRDQLVAAKEMIMSPRLREVVAKSSFEAVSVRDKGMMLGDGAVWITPTRLALDWAPSPSIEGTLYPRNVHWRGSLGSG